MRKSVAFALVRAKEFHKALTLIQSDILRFFSLNYTFFIFFIKIWHEYDTDGSGFLEADELKVIEGVGLRRETKSRSLRGWG